MEVNMTINRSIVRYVGACAIAIMAFYNDGLCQTYSVIDIDRGKLTILPDEAEEIKWPENKVEWNDIFRIVSRIKTSYEVEYIPGDVLPIISNGRVFVELDHKKTVYDLTSVKEITDTKNLHYFDYNVFYDSDKIYKKDEWYKATFGHYQYEIFKYYASVDVATGDTLWKKRADKYVYIKQANHLSLVNDSIIDNKSGNVLFVLKSSSRLNIDKIKEDDGYLYLIRGFLQDTTELVAIDTQKGEVAWRVKSSFTDIYFDENKLYTSNQCVLDKKTGELLLCKRDINVGLYGIVDNYLIAREFVGDDDPYLLLYNKNTGELVSLVWGDKEICKSCFGFDNSCNLTNFVFAEQGEGNRTVGLIRCIDGVYLYVFEVK